MSKQRKDPAYLREQGNREANVKTKRRVTFSFIRLITNTEGQSFQDWENLGLLAVLSERLRFVGQYSCQEALQSAYIKQYTKVSFPPSSGFTQPKHIPDAHWAVMHITANSKEVVAGFIEDDVFYIVFLDKDHQFWPMSK